MLWLALQPLATTATWAQPCGDPDCTQRKPRLLIVMDYSSSMVDNAFPAEMPVGTRWDAQLAAVRDLLARREVVEGLDIALARFGHDPDPSAEGSGVRTDSSEPPLRDGFVVDVPFASGQDDACNGQPLDDALERLSTTPPPPVLDDFQSSVGTWTRGALLSTWAYVEETSAQAVGDAPPDYEVLLMTDG